IIKPSTVHRSCGCRMGCGGPGQIALSSTAPYEAPSARSRLFPNGSGGPAMRSCLRLVAILILGCATLAQAQFPDQGNAGQDRPGGQTPAHSDSASQRGDESRPLHVMPILGDPQQVTAPGETGVQGTAPGQQQIDNRSTQWANVSGETGQTS